MLKILSAAFQQAVAEGSLAVGILLLADRRDRENPDKRARTQTHPQGENEFCDDRQTGRV